jgi:catechol 2,3-dioxygenase-like lactoylglutathione lyase family enzyme
MSPSEAPSSDAVHVHRPTSARWTHLALRVADIDATIAWYLEFTPLELLERRNDDDGYGAWLGHPDRSSDPFILVLAQFLPDRDPFAPAPIATLAPFNHLGIELPARADVDDIAARGAAVGCLAGPARQMPPPIGYICLLHDPDGNLVEFSFDQGVYDRVREMR